MAYRVATEISQHLGHAYRRLKPELIRLGAVVDTPSGDGYVIRTSCGNRSVAFSVGALPINAASSHILARDKLATYQLLEGAGVRVPRGVAFFAEKYRGSSTCVPDSSLVANLELSIRTEFPAESCEQTFVIKPSSQSHGLGLLLCRGLQAVLNAASEALVYGHCGIVQEFIDGTEYRLVILDDEILVAYRKHNPILVGDGKLTQRGLIHQFNDRLRRFSPTDNPRLLDTCALPPLQGQRSWGLDSIPPEGEVLELALELQNLRHGTWPEVMAVNEIPGDILAVALEAHHLLGLRYSGVDIRLPYNEACSVVVEVNGNPGFTFLDYYEPELTARVTERLARAIIEGLT